MAAAVTRVYREDPALVPKEPLASVNMYSGTGAQRLYAISINYGMTSDELDARTAQLRAVHAFAELDASCISEAELAYETVDRRGGLSLVRIRLHTGRTHQIRVQFAHAGWPLLRDTKYGNTTVA